MRYIIIIMTGVMLAFLTYAYNRIYLPPISISKLSSQYKYIDPKTGYRMGHYRAPTPDSIKGAIRITTLELEKMLNKPDVVLIDVMAHIGAGWDPLSGEWLISKPRLHIPQSTWLPDVGAGSLSPELTKYFKSNIHRLTNGKKSRPLVIYCQSDCWMSWNAVRRLADWGYDNLFWYPEGHDGWLEANHNLVNAAPIPLNVE